MSTATFILPPADRHNQALLAHVHPPGWVNPKPATRYDMVVIGAGTAGLVTAAGAAGLGAKVALVERRLMGGDCLNFGCVPSKTLLHASRTLSEVRRARDVGIRPPSNPMADFEMVMDRVRALRAKIGAHDSAARFRDMGVDVFIGEARFISPDTVAVEDRALRFRRACIATGTRPALPPIGGLEKSGHLTNETVFSLTSLPLRMGVIGGGPIGCELGQAMARLGSEVTLFQQDDRLLPQDEPEASKIVQSALQGDGVNVMLNAKVTRIESSGGKRIVVSEESDGERRTAVDELLVAVGRQPNVEPLDLRAAGIEFSARGVTVSDRLRTTNPRVYAAGDICSRFKFTHAADAMARIVIRNALFFGRKRASSLIIPWCTYTDPEVAHVGLTVKEATEQSLAHDLIEIPLEEIDRAQIEGERGGFLLVLVSRGGRWRRGGRLLGATLVSRHAGEMISEMTLAMMAGLRIATLSNTIHPYPTVAEVFRRAGDMHQRRRLTPFAKAILHILLRLNR